MATTDDRQTDEPTDTGEPVRSAAGTAAAALGWLLGALSLVGGLTWLLLNLHGPHPVVDVLVGAVLTAGGLVLLMPHRIRLPRVAGAAGTGAAALAGTVGGLAVSTSAVCCAFAYVASRGWPFHWLQRGAVAENADTARSLALAADWQVDVVALVGNVLVWAYAGMLVVVGVVLVRRARPARDADRGPVGDRP
jgi:hypothetical protein